MNIVTFFNPYDFRITIKAIHSFLPSYECSALPKQKGELLEGFTISQDTLATYQNLIITSNETKIEENKNIELDFTEAKVKTNDK